MNTNKSNNETKHKMNNKPQNHKQLEVDGMPPQVATELLCAPKARMTARQRKTCWAARSKVYCSTLKQKPVEEKLANRMRRASWAQIGKWTARTESRGALLESAYSKVLRERHALSLPTADRNNPEGNARIQARIIIIDKIISALELKRAQLMVFSDAIRTERSRREVDILDKGVSSPVAL